MRDRAAVITLTLLLCAANARAQAPSDNCEAAELNSLITTDGVYEGDLSIATPDGPPSSCSADADPSVWWVYQASVDGVAVARTCASTGPLPDGPGLDTILDVFADPGGAACPGALLDCNDDDSAEFLDGGCGYQGRRHQRASGVVFPIQQGARYWIRIRGRSGLSTPVSLELLAIPSAPPAFVREPRSRVAGSGASVEFCVAATGRPAPQIQWRKDGVLIPDATSPTLSLGPVSAADAGEYACELSSPAGSATATAALVVQAPAAPAFLAGATLPLGAGAGPIALVAAQLDADGRDDLGVANLGGQSVAVLRGEADGSLSAIDDVSLGAAPSAIAAGSQAVIEGDRLVFGEPYDFPLKSADVVDLDDRHDLVVATAADVGFIRNVDGASFDLHPTPLIDGARAAVQVTDMNGAYAPDTVGLSTAGGGGAIAVRLGGGCGSGQNADGLPLDTETVTTGPPLPEVAGRFAAGLLFGDRTDLALTYPSSGQVGLALGADPNDGTCQVPLNPFATTFAVGNSPSGIVVADLDGDGLNDVAVALEGDDRVVALRNTGASLSPQAPLVVGAGPRDLIATDLDGDDDVDLAVANAGSNDVTLLINDGAGAFLSHTLAPPLDTPVALAAGDFNGDGALDLAVANFGGDSVTLLLNNALGGLQDCDGNGVVDAFQTPPPICCLGDLNGDNQVSLTDLSTLLSNFGLASGATPQQGDLDGDEDVDITDLALLLSVFGTACA